MFFKNLKVNILETEIIHYILSFLEAVTHPDNDLRLRERSHAFLGYRFTSSKGFWSIPARVGGVVPEALHLLSKSVLARLASLVDEK